MPLIGGTGMFLRLEVGNKDSIAGKNHVGIRTFFSKVLVVRVVVNGSPIRETITFCNARKVLALFYCMGASHCWYRRDIIPPGQVHYTSKPAYHFPVDRVSGHLPVAPSRLFLF